MSYNTALIKPYAFHALAAIGAAVVAKHALSLLFNTYFYFLKPSTVKKYLHGPAPYAIVTGATDGIGKAVARELYDKGFNLILHGRSEEKMQKVVEDIRGRRPGDVKYFLADATAEGLDFGKIVEPFQDLNITLVVHNVGLAPFGESRIDAHEESLILSLIRLNAAFPTLLTRALLPRLRATAARGPVEVQFVGSITADSTPPGYSIYGATKAYLKALVRGLDNDERAWGPPSGVHFTYLNLMGVSTKSNPAPEVTASTPSTTDFAKAVVSHIGCGYRAYPAWVWHAAQMYIIGLLPEKTVDGLLIEGMEDLKKKRELRSE